MDLGRLEKVDLRRIWETEAGDFTPWLAQEENIKLLGDTIGLELEVEAQEKEVGPFRADILCKDTGTDTNNWVLIENQLERTDHTHLGQLITYAAGLNAVTIVWVSARFTDEHRAALDWLNGITDEQFNFFGLEVELWRIGSSPVAPKFNVVSQPNDWGRTVKTATARLESEGLTETKQLQLEYWTDLRSLVLNESATIKPQKPLPQHWTNFAIGRAHFMLQALVDTWDKRIRVLLHLGGPDAKAHFNLLYRDKEAIEREIGESLDWKELPENKSSHINLWRDMDPTDKASWAEQHRWIMDKLEKFHRVFGPRVKQLDADEYRTEDSE